jgi:hypothetical protein
VISLRRSAGKTKARFFLAARPSFFAALMRRRAVAAKWRAAMVLRKSFREVATECETPVELKALRTKLAAGLAQTDLCCPTPQITHLTLARFKRAVPLTTIRREILDSELPRFECVIDRVMLSRELVYPSLQTRTLRTFPLGG